MYNISKTRGIKSHNPWSGSVEEVENVNSLTDDWRRTSRDHNRSLEPSAPDPPPPPQRKTLQPVSPPHCHVEMKDTCTCNTCKYLMALLLLYTSDNRSMKFLLLVVSQFKSTNEKEGVKVERNFPKQPLKTCFAVIMHVYAYENSGLMNLSEMGEGVGVSNRKVLA